MGWIESVTEGVSSKVSTALSKVFARQPIDQGRDLQKSIDVPYMGRNHWYGGTVTPWGRHALLDYLFIDQDLMKRFCEYEEMDEFPEAFFSLNVYADDATTPNPDLKKCIWVYSQDRELEKDLNGVLRRCRADADAWPAIREFCKYGNEYAEMNIRADKGVVGLSFMPPPTMRRVETSDKGLIGYIQDPNGAYMTSLSSYHELINQKDRRNGSVVAFEPWEVIHWRLRLKYFRSIYGHSILEGARPAWKRLAMLEDGTLIYKFERAHQRFAFYVDVGSMDLRRGMPEVAKVRDSMRRRKLTNASGMLDMKKDVLTGDDDFFIPVKDGKRTVDVDLMASPDYSETDTLRHFRQKFAVAVNIPPSRFGWEDMPDSRSMLSSTSIDFARADMRVQRAWVEGWDAVCATHLAATNRKDVDPETYGVRMNIPSQILELARMEVLSARADVADRMKELVGTKQVLMHIFEYSEDQAVDIMRAKRSESLDLAKTDAEAQKMMTAESFDRSFHGSRAVSKDELMTVVGRDAALMGRMGRISGMLEDIRRLGGGLR